VAGTAGAGGRPVSATPCRNVSLRPYGEGDLRLLERLLDDPVMTAHPGGRSVGGADRTVAHEAPARSRVVRGRIDSDGIVQVHDDLRSRAREEGGVVAMSDVFESVVAENERLNAYIDAVDQRADYESFTSPPEDG
jgi:hypothetical protein